MNIKHEIRPGQSVELLKELHILTRDGKLNQDSRRKLKQVYHLYQFIEPLLLELKRISPAIQLVDLGAGKSYLGFILFDLFFKNLAGGAHIFGIESREELVEKSRALAEKLGFAGMSFLDQTVADTLDSTELPKQIDIVTALHACNTATDDAIRFALQKQAKFIVLVPCCQAEVASILRKNKVYGIIEAGFGIMATSSPHSRIRQPHHQRVALPATGGTWLPGQRHRTGRLGAFHEKRVDHRPPY